MHCIQPETSHLGRMKTIKYIQNSLYWPSMMSDIENFIACCRVCIQAKKYRGFKVINRPIAGFVNRLERLCIDVFGLLALPKSDGYIGILTIQDAFSRFTRFIPIKNKKSATINKVMEANWTSIFGVPKYVRVDNAKELIRGVMKTWCFSKNILLEPTGIFSSQQNGGVERIHRFLLDQLNVLKATSGSLKKWPQFVNMVALKYNNTVNSTIQETPFYIIFGRDANTSCLGATRIKSTQWRKENDAVIFKQYQKQLSKSKLKIDVKLFPGDLVFTPIKKQDKLKFSLNKGPFRVIEIMSSNTYKIQHISNKKTQITSGKYIRKIYSVSGEV